MTRPACFCCRLLNSVQKKDGCSASDSDLSELLAMGSQCVDGDGCRAGAQASPVCDTVVTRPAVKQLTQPHATVGRHRVVARFDGRPRRPTPNQSVSRCCVNVTCSSCPVSTSTRQRDIAAHTADSVADVHELATFQDDGDQTHSVLSALTTFSTNIQISFYPNVTMLCLGICYHNSVCRL